MRKHLNILTLAAAVLLAVGPSAAADSDLTRLVKKIQPAVVTVIVYDTERHLLYVACTRARDHLLVTC